MAGKKGFKNPRRVASQFRQAVSGDTFAVVAKRHKCSVSTVRQQLVRMSYKLARMDNDLKLHCNIKEIRANKDKWLEALTIYMKGVRK